MPYSKFEVGRLMFIGLDFSPLWGGFIKPPALRVVGDWSTRLLGRKEKLFVLFFV